MGCIDFSKYQFFSYLLNNKKTRKNGIHFPPTYKTFIRIVIMNHNQFINEMTSLLSDKVHDIKMTKREKPMPNGNVLVMLNVYGKTKEEARNDLLKAYCRLLKIKPGHATIKRNWYYDYLIERKVAYEDSDEMSDPKITKKEIGNFSGFNSNIHNPYVPCDENDMNNTNDTKDLCEKIITTKIYQGYDSNNKKYGAAIEFLYKGDKLVWPNNGITQI